MDKKKKRMIIFTVFSLAVITICITVTYAFFTGNIDQTENETITMTSGTLSLTFRDRAGSSLKIEKSLWFGDTVEKEFEIENTGSLDAYAKIMWDDLINTYLSESLSYTLEYKSLTDDEYKKVKTVGNNVPTSTTSSTKDLTKRILIPSKETYIYKLTIKLEDLDYVDQTEDLKANFSTKFTIKEEPTPSINELMSRDMDWNNFDNSYYKTLHDESGNINLNNIDFTNLDDNYKKMSVGETIEKVVFETSLEPKENAIYTWDLSTLQKGGVIGYLVPTEEGSIRNVLYIQANGKIIGNPDCEYLFGNFNNLKTIEGLENFDTNNVTNMSAMFADCSSLIALNSGNFDTSNVTDMSYIFSGCSNLTSLNVSNFDTSNVVDMNSMFADCSNLTSLDLSNFDTSKVTNMSGMFYDCSNLTSLDLSNFDTSKVTNMSGMFIDCSNLTSLDLSNFDTSNVTDMSYMFFSCSSLTALNVSQFNTGNVTDMRGMFNGCTSLTSLDLSNFDTSNVTDMSWMFNDCSSLTSLDVSDFDTSKVTNMSHMFAFCSSLTSLDVSKFNTSKVTDMASMFQGCSSLISLNISNFNISNVTDNLYIFRTIPSSIKITVSDNNLKQWAINASDSPKLTDSNFVVKA